MSSTVMSSTKEKVRRRSNFERLVRRASSKVKGRRGSSGRSAMARCPFHDDNTPSMSVDFDEGLYHCFACDAGGDIFDWVMRRHRLSFSEAMEWLKEEFNIDLDS